MTLERCRYREDDDRSGLGLDDSDGDEEEDNGLKCKVCFTGNEVASVNIRDKLLVQHAHLWAAFALSPPVAHLPCTVALQGTEYTFHVRNLGGVTVWDAVACLCARLREPFESGDELSQPDAATGRKWRGAGTVPPFGLRVVAGEYAFCFDNDICCIDTHYNALKYSGLMNMNRRDRG